MKASLLGSILANLLLILGMCFLFGGLRFREQVKGPAKKVSRHFIDWCLDIQQRCNTDECLSAQSERPKSAPASKPESFVSSQMRWAPFMSHILTPRF